MFHSKICSIHFMKDLQKRFDPTVEHTVGRKIAERSARGRLTHQQLGREGRDSSADGVARKTSLSSGVPSTAAVRRQLSRL